MLQNPAQSMLLDLPAPHLEPLALGTLQRWTPDPQWPRAALLWQLPEAFVCTSWALAGGPHCVTDRIVWLQVNDADLPPHVCPTEYVAEALAARSCQGALSFLTSAQLHGVRIATAQEQDLLATVVVTAGLGNALRAGDPAAWSPRVGTINIACAVNASLSPRAQLEGLCLMTEAKTAAVFDAGILSRISGQPATGTGTDCQALASPSGFTPLEYVGKHTRMGSLIGKAVYEAVLEACLQWRSQYPQHCVLGKRP